MKRGDQSRDGHLFRAALERMRLVGWIESWDDTGDAVTLVWTRKGRKRARALREIDSEIAADGPALAAVATICKLFRDDTPGG